MNSNPYDHLFKIVVLGEAGVGKSTMILRYVDRVFSESYISTVN